jgi:hypothetical protein
MRAPIFPRRSPTGDIISGQKAPHGRIRRNFRLHMQTPLHRADIAQLSVEHTHTQGNPEGVTWHLVTSGTYGTCTTTLKRTKLLWYVLDFNLNIFWLLISFLLLSIITAFQCRGIFCIKWCEVRSDCSFCWYWFAYL